MNRTLRLLNIEDSDDDSLLIRRHLARAGYSLQFERVDSQAGLEAALARQGWDVVVSDYVMPGFGALEALNVIKKRSLDIPFIIVSGAIGEEIAVAAMRAGAHDYVMKDNLVRLAPAIEREIQECDIRREQKHTEEALRSAEKLASLGRLAASIAHEVNNPLEAITNIMYLLGYCDLDAVARNYVQMAEQELERVTHVVRQALAFSRVSTEQMPVPVSQLVDQVLNLYAPRINSGQVHVEKRFEFDAEVPGELRQVLSNLIINAVDAVGANGRVLVHVKAANGLRGQTAPGVLMYVADNGCGISPDHRQDIFRPFFSTKAEKGNGLGLWISNEIVHKHGGSMRVHSSTKAGHSGTIFSIFLPLATVKTRTAIAS